MIRILHLGIGFFLILLIVPQTPTENIVLRKLVETGFFLNYSEAKTFLIFLTWCLIFCFLSCTLYLSLNY